jgi:adenylate cyclase
MGEDAGVTDEDALHQLEGELLGGERRYTRQQVAESAGVDYERAKVFWRALGFADLDEDVTAFTDQDVWALKTVQRLGEEGWLDDEAQVAMTRALGQSLARLAEWQLAAVGTMVDPDLPFDGALTRARELVPVVEDLMGYVWRRHLAAVAGRAFAGGPDELASTTQVVGFADLVGYTSLTRDVDEAGLARLVERFESNAADLIAGCRGRLVKTVGDEVMFVADEPATGAQIGLLLAEQVGADDNLPDLRVGIALGQLVSRHGDVYGEPVNLASRLVSIARPGSVIVDRELASALEADDRFRLRRMAPRSVRGYSLLHPYRLRRQDDDGSR